jgi:membrane-associated protease RseP (regulator of RpoE activity)
MKIGSFYIIFMVSIFVHELGHYLSGTLFKVRTLSFTVGAGPSLYDTYIGETRFSLKLFPILGIVEHNYNDIDRLSLIKNIIILLSGIFNNFIIAIFAILVICKFNFILMFKVIFTEIIPSILKVFSSLRNFIGADSSISNAYTSISVTNFEQLWLLLAVVNIGLAFGNLIPVPALDGGQVVLFILQRFLEKAGLKRETFNKIVNPIIWLSFIILLFLPLINEILATKNPILYCIYAFIGILIGVLCNVISKTELYKKNFRPHD